MKNRKAKSLIKKYLQGTATPNEDAILESWYLTTAEAQEDIPGKPDYEKIELEILNTLRAEQEIPRVNERFKIPWARLVAAASILLFLGIGGYYLYVGKPVKYSAGNEVIKNDIAPGANKAVLTLADKTTIIVDDSKKGVLANQGNISITKAANGQLVYHAPDQEGEQELTYNNLSTPLGGWTKLVLADGTRVWLNAASSLTYPTAFAGSERRVTLKGEAYFEVATDKARKFIVQTLHGDIQDIGTQFNVMAYDDEKTFNTTLLEGAVKVTEKGEQGVILKPGEQAQIANNSIANGITVIRDVDTEEAIAWKNNLFRFKAADIGIVMRQVARWYNVDIKYASGTIPSGHLTGYISRDVSLSHLIDMIEHTSKLKLSVEGKTVTVIQN